MCNALRPRVEAWCESNGANFMFVDADSDDSAGSMQAWGIKSIPSVGIVDGDKAFVTRGIDGWNLFVEPQNNGGR